MENNTILIDRDTHSQSDEGTDCSGYGFWIGSFKAFFSGISRCFDFKGRTSRFDYWGFLFVFTLFRIAVGVFDFYLKQLPDADVGNIALLEVFVFLAFAWIAFALTVRRLHDVNMRGWWVIISIVPFFVSFLKGNREANRFGPAPVTNEKKALIAVFAVFLPVAALFLFVLSIGMIAGYFQGMSKFKTVQTIDQVQQIVANVHTLFSSSNYQTLDNSGIMYQVGIYGDDICETPDCPRPHNPFDGTVSMKIVGDGFSLTYGGIPQKGCVALLTQGNWSSLRNFQGLTVNSSAKVFTGSIPAYEAERACNTDVNSITWSFL